MASDGGVLDTGLVLGLGCSSASAGHQHRPASNSAHPKLHHSDNSLALTLSRGTFEKPGGSDRRRDDCRLYRQDSAASSLSNVKRERGTGSSEEVEIGRAISSTLSDEDDDGSNGRKKLRLSKAQSAILEESFKLHSTLSPKQKQDLANDLKLRARQVEVWFQNRRARTKLKQTEVDCEFLKKCCETLKDENMRLQKELKALKLAQPLYMRLPPAALTMCPFCERICGGDSDSAAPKSTAAALAMAPTQHFCNSFTNSSAAC